MSITSLSRSLAICLVGAGVLAVAVGGSSAAQAAPTRQLSQVAFVVPSTYTSTNELDVSVAEPNLPASAFDGAVFCADGNFYPVPVAVAPAPSPRVYATFHIPAIEKGQSCYFNMGVTSQYGTSVKFDKVGPALDGRVVLVYGLMTDGRTRPTY